MNTGPVIGEICGIWDHAVEKTQFSTHLASAENRTFKNLKIYFCVHSGLKEYCQNYLQTSDIFQHEPIQKHAKSNRVSVVGNVLNNDKVVACTQIFETASFLELIKILCGMYTSSSYS